MLPSGKNQAAIAEMARMSDDDWKPVEPVQYAGVRYEAPHSSDDLPLIDFVHWEPDLESTKCAQSALVAAMREQLMARQMNELAEHLQAWPDFGGLTVRQGLEILRIIFQIDREQLEQQIDRSIPLEEIQELLRQWDERWRATVRGYRETLWPGLAGSVVAREGISGRKLWTYRVFPSTCSGAKFITKMTVLDNYLLVTGDDGVTVRLNLDTREADGV